MTAWGMAVVVTRSAQGERGSGTDVGGGADKGRPHRRRKTVECGQGVARAGVVFVKCWKRFHSSTPIRWVSEPCTGVQFYDSAAGLR